MMLGEQRRGRDCLEQALVPIVVAAYKSEG